MSLKYAWHFAIFTVANAGPVSTGSGDDGGFQGDSLVKANLSFLCIYALIYLMLTAFCIPNLLRTPRHYLGVHIALFLSLMFATISSVVSVFVLVIESNGITPLESSTGTILFSLLTLTNVFNFWSLPLLFLSICLLIRNRHSALQKARVSSVFPVVFYGLFALSMVFGTTTASLYLDYLSIIYLDRRNNHTIVWLERKIAVYRDLEYTFVSLWYLSAVITLSYAAFVYREARRFSLNDKVLRTVLFGVVPAYILLAVEGMIFTILVSPSGIKINPLTQRIQLESIDFSSVFLASFFRTLMSGIMVAIGFSNKPLYSGSADEIPL